MTQMEMFPAAAVSQTVPFAPGSETSKAAAAAIMDRAPRLRAAVFEFINGRGTLGATRDEIEVGLQMGGNTVRPRVKELLDPYQQGGPRLVETKTTRPTRSGSPARVLVAKAFGVG